MQNKIISICNDLILKRLVDSINRFRFFSVLADETTDISCQEQLTLCARYKVLAQKGKQVVSFTTSGERGVTTTIVACCNAVGNYVPRMMIFKRKNKKLSLTDYAPPETLTEVIENGWIDATSFMAYLQHFVKFIQPRKSYPVLIIMDNHKTHTKNLDLINFARDSGLILLSLPPHTSHKLQPLDQTFFKPLKSAFNAACQS